MDDDMQNHPSQIPQFLDKMEEGYDVFGVFKQREVFWFKNLTQGSKPVSFVASARPEGYPDEQFLVLQYGDQGCFK